VNTIIKDDPSLTVRGLPAAKTNLRRIILDSQARTPLKSKVVSDGFASLTTVVVSQGAAKQRVKALAARVNVWFESSLKRLLVKLGQENVTHLLVEGGGQVNASLFEGHFAHRIAFFYAPKVIGGRDAIKAVAGKGATRWQNAIRLRNLVWTRLGPDLLLTAEVDYTPRA
jgi:diaminohydroxyphosphoribosylaminopyrimidine deaminase / 5-amino-6-(5-phosphoribosylamino)uracil reductase